MNKKFIYLGLVLIIIGLSVFLHNDNKIRHAKINVEIIDNMNIEVYSKVYLSDLIKNINGKLLKDNIINTDKLGRHKVKFKYINDDNIKVSYSFKVNVVDTTSPTLSEIKSIDVYKGTQDNIVDEIFCADNYDKSPICNIEGDYNLNETGSYDVLFKAVDSSNNITSKDLTINVIEKPILKKETTVTNYDDIYNRFKNENTLVGIDISYHQGNVDYEKLKEKIDFVFLRVGYGKNRENKYVLDDMFKKHIKMFNKLKIPVGIYFFSYDESIKDAKESALWVLKQIKKYKIEYPIVYDWENWHDFKSYNLSLYDLNSLANIFIKKIEDKGYNGMLYSSKNYLKYAWYDNYNVWIAHYNENENYKDKYKLWQICDDGKIDGINSSVDIDIMFK